MPKRTTRRLGKGLDAILPSDGEEEAKKSEDIAVGQISPNPYQPRHGFDEEKLRELAESIEQHGVIQPLVVRKKEENEYELIAGERRLRAAKLAGLTEVPAIIGAFSDAQVMELAVVENLQREDLNPIEEALAYQTLLEEFGMTQEQLAERIGKSRPHISNTVRLLNLSEQVQQLVSNSQLSAGHARALLSVDVQRQVELAQEIVTEDLSVRATEKLIQQQQQDTTAGDERKKEPPRPKQEPSTDDPEVMLLEDQLRQTLGTQVRIKKSGNTGTIQIEFYDDDDLARIFEAIAGIENPL